ncbi:hypothetical protein BD626DRAFT_130464 [Schizophyllum amplum]|uniref:Uncharacterized protein n=1 Tax=Schizophyllum amplum TaxID=97359 RepID=A0A550C697_9AGAR|nr:hypothetical protein BD626DRAFT_130464 [Auriculariopsis ampla]
MFNMHSDPNVCSDVNLRTARRLTLRTDRPPPATAPLVSLRQSAVRHDTCATDCGHLPSAHPVYIRLIQTSMRTPDWQLLYIRPTALRPTATHNLRVTQLLQLPDLLCPDSLSARNSMWPLTGLLSPARHGAPVICGFRLSNLQSSVLFIAATGYRRPDPDLPSASSSPRSYAQALLVLRASPAGLTGKSCRSYGQALLRRKRYGVTCSRHVHNPNCSAFNGGSDDCIMQRYVSPSHRLS